MGRRKMKYFQQMQSWYKCSHSQAMLTTLTRNIFNKAEGESSGALSCCCRSTSPSRFHPLSPSQTFCLTLTKPHDFSVCSSADFLLLWTRKCKTDNIFLFCLKSFFNWKEPENRCEIIDVEAICVFRPWSDDVSLSAAVQS